MNRRDLVEVAQGRLPAEVIIKGGSLIDVYAGDRREADLAIRGGRIAFVGDASHTVGEETRIIEASGRILAPGLIDTHIHHCHTAFGINAFAQTMLRHGVTSFADGFYGPGMVSGIEGVRFFKEAFDRSPIRLLFLVPVLAYSQNRDLGLPASPAGLKAEDLHEILSWPGCGGLEEPPPLPVINGDPVILELLEATLAQGKVVTGHAAALTERELQAYVAAGASTDHEAVSGAEALQRIRAGITVLARQGDAGAENQADVLEALAQLPNANRYLSFCSDVAGPVKLDREGTVGHSVRLAIESGIDPVSAIEMGSLNAAEALGVDRDLGSLAPGRHADILILDDLEAFEIATVLVAGESVIEAGQPVEPLAEVTYPEQFYDTVGIAEELAPEDFALRVDRPDGSVKVRALSADNEDELLINYERQIELPLVDGLVELPDGGRIARAAVVERLGREPSIGLGFLDGMGLARGAIATTLSALTMNLIVVGQNTADMALAANRLRQLGGGKIVVADGEVLAELPLPVFGLHSDADREQVVTSAQALRQALVEIGCRLRDPFARIEFSTACQDLGEVKLSERGLLRIRPLERLSLLVD